MMTPEQSTMLPLHDTQDDTVLDIGLMESTEEARANIPLISVPCGEMQPQSPKSSFSDENGNDQHGEKGGFLTAVVVDTNKHPSDSCLSKQDSASKQESLEVHFYVGQGKQPMVGNASDLAAISPVFRAMFGTDWCRETNGQPVQIDIPDIRTQDFAVILRCALEGGATSDLPVTDDNVWDVLRASDMYQVDPVVRHCFNHLYHKHKCRERSRHVCMVLEMAHTLGCQDQHAEGLQRAQRKARQIFQSQSGLRELCPECMVRLVKADRLYGVRNETLVYYAVITWARCHYYDQTTSAGPGKEAAEPSWQELRDVAGEVINHVRFLSMPHNVLRNLGCIGGMSKANSYFVPTHLTPESMSCLLTNDEIEQLVNGQSPKGFTERADKRIDIEQEENLHRLKKAVLGDRDGNGAAWCCNSSTDIVSCVFLIGLVLLFLFAVFYIPILLAVNAADPDDV